MILAAIVRRRIFRPVPGFVVPGERVLVMFALVVAITVEESAHMY